ncbi:ANTAR domain-containing protein [Streptomyces sp. 5-10]|uniref:ANTAR domain-containing protein n=1 Tax=Streptomyces sp. 5-10 TaxID=878925 RepID=UPI001CC32864|nr:ANTAR domain-containing protein [Streptomyces sp. 5-10]
MPIDAVAHFPIERQYVAIERDDLLKKIAALEEEVGQLRQAVVSHAVIDQAIGVVIARGRLLPDQGWDVLRAVSQNTNTKVRLIAEQIVQWPYSGRLPEDIRQALEAALEATLARRADTGRPRTPTTSADR